MSLTILVVDDSKMNRITIIPMLKRELGADIHITEAVTANDAIDKVIEKIQSDRKNFDLIIMDNLMPYPKRDETDVETIYETGEEATMQIRKLEASLKPDINSKIITYSTNRQNKFLGSDAILQKPCHLTELHAVLCELDININHHSAENPSPKRFRH